MTKEDLEYFLRLDDATGELFWRVNMGNHIVAGKEAGCTDPRGRWCVKINGVRYYRSHLVYILTNGEIPSGSQIDHINRDVADDRPGNLRATTALENTVNRGAMASNTSGYIGVHLVKDTSKWRARIRIDGMVRYLRPEHGVTNESLGLL